jgi:hypothetical protein
VVVHDMCVACHQQTDPEYPSVLFLGVTENSCGDCHMKIETVDVKWVKDMDKPVHIAVRTENDAAREKARALASKALEERGFRLVDEKEAELRLTLEVRLRALRDDRFLPPGTPVRAAVIDMTVGAPDDPDPYVRRLGVSKPEWADTEEEAVKRAVRDAWAVLETHLLEAMGSF